MQKTNKGKLRTYSKSKKKTFTKGEHIYVKLINFSIEKNNSI